MRSTRIGGLLVAAATLLSVVLPGSASAESTDAERSTATSTTAANSDHRAWSRLTLTVKAARGAKTTVRLDCQPSGGSHPEPKRACLEVTAARGEFDHLPGSPEMIACTMEYRPVVAVVRGHWRGERVHWEHQYPNPCTLLSKTGVVFDF